MVDSEPVTQRLFVAIWLPEHVSSGLRSALEPLPTKYPELRWQPPNRWHITLAFLGDRDPARTATRFRQLRPPPAAPLSLAGSGRFGPILWVGVQAGPWLASLAHTVQELLGSEDRRFRGHVTVARARSAAGRRGIGGAARDLHSYRSTSWRPAEISLVRSITGPDPTYEVVSSTLLTCDGDAGTP